MNHFTHSHRQLPVSAANAPIRLAASHHHHHQILRPYQTSRAFTLTEMMIAVAVLIVVIIATSKIFGTASKITGMGMATTSVMTEAATLERMMREDVARLTTEGFFAIRCVSVQNDVRRHPPYNDPNAPLLNPNLEAPAIIRADQLVFFATGVEPNSSFRGGSGSNAKAEGTASRLYYGHVFQLPEALPANVIDPNNTVRAHDPDHIRNQSAATFGHFASESLTDLVTPPMCTPWAWGNTTMLRTDFLAVGGNGAGTNIFAQTPAAPAQINGRQPLATQWLLARQPVVLFDDDNNGPNTNSKTVHQNNNLSARSIFLWKNAANYFGHSHEIRNGRAGAAATELNDIRRHVLNKSAQPTTSPYPNYVARAWNNPGDTVLGGDQRRVITNAIYYPRGEHTAPGPNRVDQALTNHIIGSACSSFAIDWTYDEGVGRVLDANGNVLDPTPSSPNSGDELWGMRVDANSVVDPDGIPNNGDETWAVGREQPWFGQHDAARGVYPLNVWRFGGTQRPSPVWPLNIERYLPGAAFGAVPSDANPVVTYEALFGYNTTVPLNPAFVTPTPWPDPGINPVSIVGTPINVGYTPFPSAIRVTMTLHDPEGRMEGGREFQFVIRLPKRN